MCLAQGPQRSDAGEAQTCGPLGLEISVHGLICMACMVYISISMHGLVSVHGLISEHDLISMHGLTRVKQLGSRLGITFSRI